MVSRLASLSLVLLAAPAAAFEASGALVPGLAYRVLATDTLWLGERLNVLVILRAGEDLSPREVTVDLALTVPRGGELEEPAGFSRRATLTVRAGETRRFAFRGLAARDDREPGLLELTLELAARSGPAGAGGNSRSLRFGLATLRGAAVPRGPWSILAPAAMALLAVPLFLRLLRRHAAPGYWRRVVTPEIAASDDPWWRDRA